MARIGYARVSTTDQDLDIQIGRLKNAGCEIIRSETGSGASRSGRTELETIMQFMHTGDELVVLRLDRLGRSTRDVLNLVHELDEKGASLRILEPEVTTAGDMGRMVITILGMVADMELKFIKDRQRAGIEALRGPQDEVRRICVETQQTVFMITHDVDEAILLADRIVLMTNGPQAVLAEVLHALRSVRYGYVQITLQDARVVQIDTLEKKRLDR